MAHPYLAQILTELLPQALEDGVTLRNQDDRISLRLYNAGDPVL